ncbi:hypothetical protein ACA910_003205 [Epithemia clementina (nom. ined.)]
MTASSNLSYLSVLRIGPTHDNVSATILKNAVLDHFHKQQQQGLERQVEQEATNDEPTEEEYFAREPALLSDRTGGRFKVSNRYFQAQLLFQPLEHKDNQNLSSRTTNDGDRQSGGSSSDPTMSVSDVVVTDGLYHKEDGILLAFDASRSNPDLPMSVAASFDSLNLVHEQAINNGAGDLLRLCVGITLGPMEDSELRGRDYEQEYSRRILWCLDRGYEYVEADLSAHGRAQGHEERDKEGFARIIEAITGTVWSSAIMEKQRTKQLKQSYQETALHHGILQGDGNDSKEDGEMNYDKANQYIPPDPTLLATKTSETRVGVSAVLNSNIGTEQNTQVSDEARVEQARQALLRQEGEHDDDDHDDLLPTNNSEETATTCTEEAQDQARAKRIQEREQERMMDQLDGALKQAVNIREMSRSGKMTDEERRVRAGDAAMVLMNLMNSMGMVDGETDDDGSDPED